MHWLFMPGTGVTMTSPRPLPLIFHQPPVLGMWPPEPSSDQPLFFLLPVWPKPLPSLQSGRERPLVSIEAPMVPAARGVPCTQHSILWPEVWVLCT